MPKRLAIAVALGLLAMACSGENPNETYVQVGDQTWVIAINYPHHPDPRIIVLRHRSRAREVSDMAGITKTDPPESEAEAAVAEYLKTRRDCAVGGPLTRMGECGKDSVGCMPAWIVQLKCGG